MSPIKLNEKMNINIIIVHSVVSLDKNRILNKFELEDVSNKMISFIIKS